MWSDKPIKTKLNHIEMDFSDEQMNNLKNNWPTKIVDGKVEQEMPASILDEKQKEDRKTLVENMKKKIEEAKSLDDFKDILNNFIK